MHRQELLRHRPHQLLGRGRLQHQGEGRVRHRRFRLAGQPEEGDGEQRADDKHQRRQRGPVGLVPVEARQHRPGPGHRPRHHALLEVGRRGVAAVPPVAGRRPRARVEARLVGRRPPLHAVNRGAPDPLVHKDERRDQQRRHRHRLHRRRRQRPHQVPQHRPHPRPHPARPVRVRVGPAQQPLVGDARLALGPDRPGVGARNRQHRRPQDAPRQETHQHPRANQEPHQGRHRHRPQHRNRRAEQRWVQRRAHAAPHLVLPRAHLHARVPHQRRRRPPHGQHRHPREHQRQKRPHRRAAKHDALRDHVPLDPAAVRRRVHGVHPGPGGRRAVDAVRVDDAERVLVALRARLVLEGHEHRERRLGRERRRPPPGLGQVGDAGHVHGRQPHLELLRRVLAAAHHRARRVDNGAKRVGRRREHDGRRHRHRRERHTVLPRDGVAADHVQSEEDERREAREERHAQTLDEVRREAGQAGRRHRLCRRIAVGGEVGGALPVQQPRADADGGHAEELPAGPVGAEELAEDRVGGEGAPAAIGIVGGEEDADRHGVEGEGEDGREVHTRLEGQIDGHVAAVEGGEVVPGVDGAQANHGGDEAEAGEPEGEGLANRVALRQEGAGEHRQHQRLHQVRALAQHLDRKAADIVGAERRVVGLVNGGALQLVHELVPHLGRLGKDPAHGAVGDGDEGEAEGVPARRLQAEDRGAEVAVARRAAAVAVCEVLGTVGGGQARITERRVRGVRRVVAVDIEEEEGHDETEEGGADCEEGG